MLIVTSMNTTPTTMLTIAEAVEKTGRSASTIRRIIRTVTDTPDHPDRDGIEPGLKEVAAYKKKGENFTWKIREDVLMKQCDTAPKEAKKFTAERTEIVHMLQKELTLKNQQIEKQLDVIQSLNERIREGNILMGSLQKHLSLPEGDTKRQHAAATVSAPAAETATPAAMTQEQPAAAAKAGKKGILGWMFN